MNFEEFKKIFPECADYTLYIQHASGREPCGFTDTYKNYKNEGVVKLYAHISGGTFENNQFVLTVTGIDRETERVYASYGKFGRAPAKRVTRAEICKALGVSDFEIKGE